MARGTDKAKGWRAWKRTTKICLGCVVGVLVVGIGVGWYFAATYWPYRYREVEPLLESVFASKIKIDKYHRTYFPRPGFVASGLTLRRDSAGNLPPVGTAKDLIVQGSWLDMLMLRSRVQLVDVVGLKVVIPPVGSKANAEDFPAGSSADFAGPTTVVETFHIRDSELDIQRVNGGQYAFPVHDLVIGNLQKGQAISYSVDMQNAMPSGRILSKGSFGPVTPENLGGTKLSGAFTLAPVNLGDVGKIRGTLSAKGHFSGSLASVEVEADSDTPDFAVSDGRATHVTGYVQSTVNGLNGNIVLHRIEAKTGATTVQAAGTIMSAPNTPKVTNLDITVTGGRAQDVLRPFLKVKSPVAGAVSLHGHARVDGARGGETFLHRLHVEGGFNVPQERLTNKAEETSLSQLSERAQGGKNEEDAGDTDVVSSLQGDVAIRDGVISMQKLTFGIPGAEANLNGTFNLNNSNVHLVGNLKMDTDISHVTTGFKSLLLKPLAPFFKRKGAGAVIPIAVTGGPGEYKVGQDILHQK
jgi:hypothetical protein